MAQGSNPHPGIDAYRLKFSGSGGEYFRVWIVNILLTIVTLTLYTPWARRRTARYFYDHTVIAGSPLEFTAPLRKMVVGFILFALLYIAFEVAQETGQDTMVAVFLLGGATLAPYIWASAMRFRLASTRWRGLQLHFSATWKEVYRASWPIFAMAAMWIAIVIGLDALEQDLPQTQGPAGLIPFAAWSAPMWGLLALGLVLSVLAVIRVEYNYKSLLVLRGGIGHQLGRWKPQYGDFVRIWLATIGVFLLGMVLAFAIIAALSFGIGATIAQSATAGVGVIVAIILAAILGLMLLIAVSAPARAYREARMFQLIWNNVGVSQIARFKCQLSHWAYVRLRVKNLLLTVLTLGLYRPFARVSEYRMKVDSVTLYVKGGLDQLVGQLVKQQEGLGDMLADAAGLDLVG